MSTKVQQRFKRIKRVVLVLSGKGGVGKSSVSVQLARTLHSLGNTVGLLDIDLCGPSIPRMLGLEGAPVHQAPDGWTPVIVPQPQSQSPSQPQSPAAAQHLFKCMSLGFLLQSKNDAVIWRGPKKTAMIRQLLGDVCWGDLDYLVIDTPPGTSDEHISLVESIRSDLLSSSLDSSESPLAIGAVLVTTPQEVAMADVRKELTFCRKVGLNILGVVENMSGFICPHCAECTELFAPTHGGAAKMAEEFGVDVIGKVPMVPAVAYGLDAGKSTIVKSDQVDIYDDDEAENKAATAGLEAVAGVFRQIAQVVVSKLDD
ncbi:P-loop containing nucleoside triphosphate hydrolase protein [Ramicandelaber brevisporus]|nr:P-loop containing nucleoside triphosphate hydrolase protein [Ramicandelaber brevisporus]